MEYYKIINRELVKKYGTDVAKRPMYRIVQNTKSLTELRRGSVDHYAGRIYVGSVEGVHELPKYSYVKEDFWILEQLFYTTNPELVSKVSYEPLWIFKTDNDEYLAPNLKACVFVIEASRRGPLPQETEEEKAKKQRIKDMELISQGYAAGCPSDRIAWGEGTSYAGLDAKSLLNGGTQESPKTNGEVNVTD